MPVRLIYVKTKHLPLFAQAEKEAHDRKTSVSAMIAKALSYYFAALEMAGRTSPLGGESNGT